LQPVCEQHDACGEELVTNLKEIQLLTAKPEHDRDEHDSLYGPANDRGAQAVKRESGFSLHQYLFIERSKNRLTSATPPFLGSTCKKCGVAESLAGIPQGDMAAEL